VKARGFLQIYFYEYHRKNLLTPVLAVVQAVPIGFIVAIDKVLGQIFGHAKVAHFFKPTTVLTKVMSNNSKLSWTVFPGQEIIFTC
jgi:hypothetical protein